MRFSQVALALLVGCTSSNGPDSQSVSATTRHDELGTPVDAIVDFTLGASRRNNPSRRDFENPSLMATDPVAPNAVYVIDNGNGRILGWRTSAGFSSQQQADIEIAAPDLQYGSTNTTGMTVAPDGRLLLLSDYDSSCDGDCSAAKFDIYSSPFRGTPDGGLVTPTPSTSWFYWRFPDSARFSRMAMDSSGRVFVGANARVLRFQSLSDLLATAPGFNAATSTAVVLGQPDLNSFAPNRVDARGLNTPNDVAVDESASPNRLYVADTQNNRVLGWLDVASAVAGLPADLVLGQPDFNERPCSYTPADLSRSLCAPTRLAVDAFGRVFVVDSQNCRVVAFDRPAGNWPLITRAWGQPSTSTRLCYQAPSATSVGYPSEISLNPRGDLFVVDTYPNRVTLFPTQGGPPNLPSTTASQVFGPPSFTTFPSACTAPFGNICNPVSVAATNTNMYILEPGRLVEFPGIADGGFSTLPTGLVLGKASLAAGVSSSGSTTASTFWAANSVGIDQASGSLYVSDNFGNRVLKFDPPFTNFKPASAVLGQSDFVSNSGAYSNSWAGVSVTSTGLVSVAQPSNHRVLNYRLPLPSQGATPVSVVGQPSVTASAPNRTKAGGVWQVTDIAIDRSTNPNTLWVSDSQNRRVLGWPTTDVAMGQLPSVVLGPPDFDTVIPSTQTGARSFTPGVLAANNGLVLVSDSNRVLAFRMDGGAAFAVFGQPDLVSTSTDGGIIEQFRAGARALMAGPGSDFFATDQQNHRIFALRSDGGSRLTAFDTLGQDRPDLNGPNRVKASGFNSPVAVALDRSVSPNRLYVVDNINNRVLVFTDVRSISTGMRADAVLGQPTLIDLAPGSGPNRMKNPTSVAVDPTSGRVAVSDTGNHRVLLFDAPFIDGGDLVADAVLGQDSFFGIGSNRDAGVARAESLSNPGAVSFGVGGVLLVADPGNNRMLWFEPPFTTGKLALTAFGQTDVNSNSAAGCSAFTPTSLCNVTGMQLRRISDGGTSLFAVDRLGFYGASRLVRFDQPLPADRTIDATLSTNNVRSNFDFDSFGALFWAEGSLFRCPSPYATCMSLGYNPSFGPPAFDEDGSAYLASSAPYGYTNSHSVVVLLGDSAPTALAIHGL